MEEKGATPIFNALQKLPVHHRRLESLYIYIYNSGILSTMVYILDLKDVILFLQCLLFYVYISNFASPLCMYVFNVIYGFF